MNKQIWKYIFCGSTESIQIPCDAVVRHVGQDPASGQPALWVEVATTATKEFRTFMIVGTGHSLPEPEQWQYVGTAVCSPYVCHIYEQKRN